MRPIEEVKKGRPEKGMKMIGGSAVDQVFQLYKTAMEQEESGSVTKVAGGTANPILTKSKRVSENKNLTGRKTKTYAEHLQESRSRAAALAAQAQPVGETPSMQAVKEMIFGRKEGGTVNPTISAADLNSRYDKMEERERAAYQYFKSTGREQEAADYLKAIEPEINRRAAEQRTGDAKKLAEESIMGGLYARYMANLTNPLGAIYGAVQEARGEAIDPNSPLFWGQQTQEGQTEGFLGESTGAKRVLKEAALGAFDWGTQAATLGALGVKAQAMGGANSALYGASAFAGNVKDATERGATGEEAISYGAIGAAAEIVTEKLGFDRLFELGKLAKIKGGKAGLVKEILKNIGSEAGEEGTTEAANLLADAAIMGDKSQMAEIYHTAQAQGMTETEAIGEALKAAAGQIGHAGLIGGISGGMIAGGVAGLSRGFERNMLDYTDGQKEEIKQRQAAKNKEKAAVETVGEAVENGEKPPENVTESPETVIGQPQNKAISEGQKIVEEEAASAELEGFGEKYYGEKGKEVFIRMAKEKGNLNHTAAFNTYYRAGIAGIRESEIRQTAYTAVAEKMMLNEAYMAGAEDRKAEIANAIRGRNKLSGKRGLILDEDVKATEGQLALAKLYAEIGGARIRLVDKIASPVEGTKVNGYQDGDTITIALNADSFMGTMHHEMVHYIRKVNPAAYDSMRELVFNLANKSGIDMDAQMEEYRATYIDTYGEDADMMVFMEEMVADAFQKITGDQNSFENFINDLRKTEPTILEKIKEFLDEMLGFMESLLKDNTYTEFAEELSKDKENLKALRKKFAEVLADTGKMEAGTQEAQTGDAKYSKKLGGYFPNTEISTETVKAIGIKNINNVGEVIDKVCKHLKGDFLSIGEDAKPIKNIDTGMQIYVYRKGINETFGKKEFYKSLSDEWKRIKIAVALELDEIIKYGEVRANETENMHNPNSDTMFAYLTAPVTVDGKKVTVDIDIRRTNRGDRFYMHKIKVADSSSRAAVKRPKSKAELSASGESIAQEEEKNNNKNISKFSIQEKKDNAITYESLIGKPDMKVTRLNSHTMDGKGKGDVFAIAKESVRSKNNPLNTENTQFIKNTDTQKDILVGRKGIQHSMQRKWESIGVVATNIGSMLENAIMINEVEPRGEAKESYILLGYGEDEKGNGYSAYFLVNEFISGEAELEKLDVLYSTNAKKIEPAVNTAKVYGDLSHSFSGSMIEPSASPINNGSAAMLSGVSTTHKSDSTISIEDLIGKVNAIYSDILPQSVADHFGNTRRETKLGQNVKFSMRKESIEADIAGNEHWKAAYEGLLREFEVTKEPLKDRESAKKVARKFLKSIKSAYDEDEFTERFAKLCNYGADMRSDGDYKELLTACTMLAEDALQKSVQMNTELYDRYADLRKQLRGYTLHISKDTLKELEAMGINYNELRMENFGRVRISQKSGEKIDTKYAELAGEYPELFKMEQSTSQGELLMDMIAVRESLDPTIENPYFDNMEEYAAASAYELLGMMNEVALEKQTFADKYEERLRKLREENKKSLKNAREQAKNEKKLLQEKYATNAEARIEAVKQKYEKRLDRKEYWRLRKLAVKDAKALAEWLKAPTDKNHVPEKFKESVETILALIETEKPDLQIPLKSFVAMRGGLMELYGDTQGIYLYVEQDDQVINILDRFIQKYPEGANLDTMDGTDMKYFRNLIASVKKACTDANKLHTSQREKTAVSVSEEFINASQKKKDAKETKMIRRIQDFLGLEMLDANSFFKRIGGSVYTELWKGLRKGMDKKIGRWREAMDFINELADPKDVRAWTEEAAKEFEIGGVKVYLTIPQIMSLACLMRRSQGRQHIIGMDIPTENGILQIRGGGFKAEYSENDKKAKREKAKVVEPTEAEVREIIATLTEEQERVAYAIQQYLSNEVAAWGNETSMLLFGYEKFTTKNYFPIVSDKNFVNQPVTKVEDIAPSLRSMGITKNVNQYANNPVIIQDIFRVFANHVDQMSSYNAFVASESDFNKFMNYKVKAENENRIYSVKDEMDRTMGEGGIKYIKNLMNRLVTATKRSDDSDLAKMFVRNMKVASVGANLRVIVQQPTAYLRAANQMSLKYLLNPAVFKKTDKKIIYKYAPIALWKSWGNYEMDTGKSMYEQIIAPTKFDRTKDILMKGAGLADEWTWSRLWNACVLETGEKHPGLSKEEIYTIAGERFGEIVDESQVVDSILHRSQIMRKKGLYTQMVTSFMSEPMKNFNMASNALVELVRDNTPENRKKFIRCYMTLIASGIATACVAGLVDAMRDDDDEETFFEKWKKAVAGDYSEAETPKDFVMAILSNNIADNLNPMGMIPYLRDIWSVIQGYDIKRTDFDWLNDILKSMKRWKDFAAGKSEYTLYSMLMNTAGAISKLTGIPLGSAERDAKALCNMIVYYIIGDDEMKYDYRKLSKDIGSEKNVSDYVGRILRAKFSGNEGIATKIYNDMVKAGISNETIDSRIETQEKKALKEEPATQQAAEAYAKGDIDRYLSAYDSLSRKGYTGGNIGKAITSAYNKMKGGEEEEETFETITSDYWDRETEADFADYEMLFNAYMAGNERDYDRIWDLLEAAGKKESSMKQSMKNRLKTAYQKAKKEGNYQEAQKAKAEFLRLGGKPETLEKE